MWFAVLCGITLFILFYFLLYWWPLCCKGASASAMHWPNLNWMPCSVPGLIQSAFFYGYAAMSMPGGWLAGRYGGKRVIAGSMLLNSLLTWLTPVAATVSVECLVLLRTVQGLAQVRSDMKGTYALTCTEQSCYVITRTRINHCAMMLWLVRTPSPTIPGSNSTWTFRWIGQEGRGMSSEVWGACVL